MLACPGKTNTKKGAKPLLKRTRSKVFPSFSREEEEYGNFEGKLCTLRFNRTSNSLKVGVFKWSELHRNCIRLVVQTRSYQRTEREHLRLLKKFHTFPSTPSKLSLDFLCMYLDGAMKLWSYGLRIAMEPRTPYSYEVSPTNCFPIGNQRCTSAKKYLNDCLACFCHPAIKEFMDWKFR